MADYRFKNPHPVKPCRTVLNGFTEANSQTFKAGQLVYFNSGVTACASDTWGTTDLLGIALKDATNVTSGNIVIPIYPIYAGDLWEMPLTNGGTDTALSSFTKGLRYGLYVASNVCYLDLAETTTDLALLVGEADTTNRPYWGKVLFIPATLYFQTGTGD